MKYFSLLWNYSRGIRWNTVVRIILANRHGVNSRQLLTIPVNSFHDVTFFK